MNEEGTNKLMIKINWVEKKKLNYLVLKEAIPFSQRVEKFKICYEENGNMKECYNGTTIGYKRIVDLKGIQTDCLAIVIERFQSCTRNVLCGSILIKKRCVIFFLFYAVEKLTHLFQLFRRKSKKLI